MRNEKDQEQLDQDIEELELHDMDEQQIEKVVKALSPEGLRIRRERKGVRYQLYRLKGEAEGRTHALCDDEFRAKFENQKFFGGWINFSQTWDVAMDDPYRIVHREHSVQDEWDELVAAKFPNIKPGGEVVYPDIKVRKKVEAEAKLQEAKKKKAKKKGSK